MTLQDDLLAPTRTAQAAITRDESAIRAQQQEMIIRRQAIAALIEAIDKAIGRNGNAIRKEDHRADRK